MKDPGPGPLDETLDASGSDRPAMPANDEHAFAGGQILAGRWRIVRFLARGGMGEVYEAVDTELGVTVALKSVRADVAERAGAIDRFKREIQLARQVTHPGVCRIYDLGAHEGTSFLTMELLAGETLGERIRARGKLTSAQAAPIVAELCAGLGAAHEAGVVHRDFKSGNVVLVARPGGGDRAVITDFGLARVDDSAARPLGDGGAAEGAATSPFVGTPAYMAPEQVMGMNAGPAADIYALGIVLFEMVTGRVPFQEATPLATAMARTRESAPSATAWAPDLDARWTRTIARCLERDPTARFASAADVWRALDPDARSRRGPARLALAMTGIAVVAFGAALLLRPAPAASLHGAPHARPSIAVLGFKNVTGAADVAWISTGLAEMLATELAAGEQLRVVPGETIARAKRELDLHDADGYAPDTLARLRGAIGVDYVLVGSYVDQAGSAGRTLRVDLLLQDARTGEPVAQVGERGAEDDLTDLASRAGAALRAKAGVALPGATDASQARAALPTNLGGARAYAEALDALRRGDPEKARTLLEDAIGAGQRSPLFYSALSQAWADLGYDDNALAAAKKAFEGSDALPVQDRLLVRGRYFRTAHDPGQAVRELGALARIAPDDLEIGLLLVDAQIDESTGDAAPARATLAWLRALPAPDGDDPRIDLEESDMIARISGDPRSAAILAERAAARAAARGETLVRADALDAESFSLLFLGDLARARRAADEARALYEAAGSRAGLAHVFNDLGGSTPDGPQSREWFLESCRRYAEIGNHAMTVASCSNALFDDVEMGDTKTARADFEHLRELAQVLPAARRTKGLEPYERWIRLEEGDPGGVLDAYRLDWDAHRESGRQRGQDGTRYGNALRALDRLDEAEKVYDESVAILRDLGVVMFYVEIVYERTRLDLLEGRAVQAEALARDAVERARATGTIEFLAYVEPELAWAHALLGRKVEAARELAECLALPDLGDLRIALGQAQAALIVDELGGRDTAADVARLEKVRAMAERYGYPEMILEARLALARHAHDASELAAIAKEAGARFPYLARRALAEPRKP